MTVLSYHDQASFETTKRLLAEVVNEGLVRATLKFSETRNHCQRRLILYNYQEPLSKAQKWVEVGLQQDTYVGIQGDRVVSLIRAENLRTPVVIGYATVAPREELDPELILEFMIPWLVGVASEALLIKVGRELKNCSLNQEKWLEICAKKKRLQLTSTSSEWEGSLVFGHPSHPFHRLCYPQTPLKPFSPDDLPGMLTPDLAFVSVPRIDMRITGPFEETLNPLLSRLDIPQTTKDRITVPCLRQQLPAIQHYFPNAVILKTVSECVDAQASIRTLTTRPELKYEYHLKLALACQITSALRTITPWTTVGSSFVTELLQRFLPPDMWVFKEVAAITGAQEDFSQAKHMSCILRSDLGKRARASGETLILAAGLVQTPLDSSRCYAEILYYLDNPDKKKAWLRKYVACLLKLTLRPLVEHGIGLEAHGQNLVARVCLKTMAIKGFAVRDFGGVRIHVPTLKPKGVTFDAMPPGSATMTDDLHNVWSKVHHSLLQNHVGSLLSALELESDGGWSIVREEMAAVLRPERDIQGRKLYEFFLKDTMPFKCFLRMRMEGKYRDYVEREVPNVALMDSPRWETILRDYQPSLHWT